jgi:flagellar biosynthetic protein FlhB
VFSYAGHINYVPDDLVAWLSGVFTAVIAVVAPILLVIVIIAVLMNVFQTGPIFSFYPIKPDFKKLNPMTGLKRIFSIRTIYETIKTLLKLALFGAIVYFFIIGMLPQAMGFIHIKPDAYAFLMLGHVQDLVLRLVALMILFALIDLVYSRRDYSEKMKMSRREVKDEVKRREGDPQVRAKIKELQREASKRAGSVSKVPDADVLITNPTHKSVAILFKRDSMTAPKVVAKGAGELAIKMRKVARDNSVPIVENKPLARSLFKMVSIDDEIPTMFYAEVARVLVRVYSQRKPVQPGLV